ncbi:MAG TPA: ATPase domain-containing protein [Methylomirabilota bacterium]|nr:ATPase domain-containing protein [Methylomirabilota bacterium]
MLCPTGIEGLDEVLNGGLPRHRFYLLEGDPGVGKTTLALQFLLEGVQAGEKCLYITLSESKDEIEQVARSHGWSLESIHIVDLSALEKEMGAKKTNTLFHPSEVELHDTVEILKKYIDRIQPVRVVFDSLSELRLMAEMALRYRRQLLAFKQFFTGKRCTVLLLNDNSHADEGDAQVQSIAHGVIVLEKLESHYGVERRRLRIEKLRGREFRGGNHDYAIGHGGLRVFPRLVAANHGRAYLDKTLKSGVEELDRVLGGGLDVGTSNLFMGPAGTSKTTLALQYAFRVASNGGKVRFLTFDETPRVMCKRAKNIGMDLAPFLDSGTLMLKKINPSEMPPGEFAHQIKTAVESEKVELVVIDSLNGYLAAMGDEHSLTLHLHELLTYLGHQGVTSILTMTQAGLVGPMQSPADITYLADTVVLLRFFEAGGAVKKALSVMKKRTDSHETTIREFRVDSQGLRIGEPLHEFHGVLTGVPTFVGTVSQMMETRDERRAS